MLYASNPIIKHKAGLLNLDEELGNVSKACKVMGVSIAKLNRPYLSTKLTPLLSAKLEQAMNYVNWVCTSLLVVYVPSGFATNLENFKSRLIALEKQVASNGIILTDEQVVVLERKKHDY